jgi:ELWxxDGT repeat protein
MLLDVNPGVADSISAGQGFFPVGNLAMFWADDGVHGREPWVTDGTEGGTRILADIYPGPIGSPGTGTAAAGGLRFFVADDGAHGFELWKTDGTPEGTALVRDINPGPAGAFIYSSLTAAFREVYFIATDGVTGEELWRSDGTAVGTTRVADLFPGPSSSPVGPFERVFQTTRRSGSRMFFVADDGTTGFELWSAPIGMSLYVITPCRLLDTRVGGGQPVTDGEVRRFPVAGTCGIPPGAAQVVANVTVVSPTADGSVEVGPGGPTWTGLGTSSFAAGRTRANNATVALGTDGSAAARLSASWGTAHLVVDVTAYFR